MKRLPIHLGVHYIGCAEARPNGVGVPSRAGAFVECLAERVDEVTVVASDPPVRPGFADGVEYAITLPNVAFLSLGPQGTWRDLLRRRRIASERVAGPSSRWDLLLYYHLPNRRAHLVYSNALTPRSAAYFVGTSAPSAIDSRLRRRPLMTLSRAWQGIQHARLLRCSDLLLANSEELLAAISPHPRCVRVVHISHRRARHAHRQRDRMDRDVVDLMIAGRLTLEKGVLVAVDTLRSLVDGGMRVRLHVVGQGPAQDEMVHRARVLGVEDLLVFHGWIPSGDRLFELYRSMDVLLLPGYGDEGFPSVIWEAMAQSVLVVSTRLRGVREAFEEGQELLFVPMHDPTAVGDAVRRLSRDEGLRMSLISNAYDRAREVSMEVTVDDMVDAILRCWPELSSRA